MTKSNESGATSKKGNATVFALAALAALVGFAAVYGTLGRPDNTALPDSDTSATATGPADTSRRRAPGLPTFVYKKAPEPLAEVNFIDESGAAKTLADFHGKTVLLNLWATWCAPCREEMPSLDRLQQQLGSDKFEVVALAVDRTGPEAARKFLDSINVKSLALYADPTTRSGSALKAIGMPTTILIDAEGREIGRLAGPSEWDSEDVKRLVMETVATPATN